MFFYITPAFSVPDEAVIGIFDMDSATVSADTRKFLRRKEKEKKLISTAKDIPKSFILTDALVYLAQTAPASLRTHGEK